LKGLRAFSRPDWSSDSGRWLLQYPRAVPVAAFLLVVIVTALSVVLIERSIADRERIQLVRAANAFGSTLETRAAVTASYLRAGAAMFGTTGFSPEDFRGFARELQLDRDNRGIEGIGWAPVISRAEIAGLESRLSDERGAPYEVFPDHRASEGDVVVPVTHLEPDRGRNRAALGFDLFSDPERRAALLEAAELRAPVASGRVDLVHRDEGPASGIIIYMPVFGMGDTGNLPRGYVYSPIHVDSFLRSARASELRDSPFSIRFYDGEPAAENLLGSNGEFVAGSRVVAMPVTIANREMTLVLGYLRAPTLSMLSLITLLSGLAVASLLMLVARLLTKRALEDRERLRWFAEQNSIRNSLTRELNHRVKNTLANVLSILALTRRRAKDVDSFADGLAGRIRALSATHDLLTRSEWGTVPINAVVDAELAPYINTAEKMVTRSGPDLELAPNDALSLGMALHELATNASKFGALSTPAGHVSITWALVKPGLAEIHWTETGGPPVDLDPDRGFGTDLIEKVVAHELKHPVKLDFHKDGVRCTLLTPIRQPTVFAMRAASAPQNGTNGT
jgi:two-component sensor histidine kinase